MENRKNREVLKLYFRSGSFPTEAQFADLIDSVPNLAEDGQTRSKNGGLLLYPITTDGLVASAYKDPDIIRKEGGIPCWSFFIGNEKEFFLKNEKGETVLSLTQDKKLHIYDEEVERQTTEDINGRPLQTNCDYLDIVADSAWHDLPIQKTSPKGISVSRVYRIIASYRTGREKYRMTDVTASYCKGAFSKIVSRQKRWIFWKSPIRFRWKKRGDVFFLQIRGKKKKRGEEMIHCQIKELWNYFDDNK